MVTSRSRLLLTLAALAAGLSAQSAHATESVAGRYITGIYAQPGAGIVPPYPGFYYGVSNIFYHGEANIEVPFPGGTVDGNVETTTWITALGGLYVPAVDLPGQLDLCVPVRRPLRLERNLGLDRRLRAYGRSRGPRRYPDHAASVRLAQCDGEHLLLDRPDRHGADRRL